MKTRKKTSPKIDPKILSALGLEGMVPSKKVKEMNKKKRKQTRWLEGYHKGYGDALYDITEWGKMQTKFLGDMSMADPSYLKRRHKVKAKKVRR